MTDTEAQAEWERLAQFSPGLRKKLEDHKRGGGTTRATVAQTQIDAEGAAVRANAVAVYAECEQWNATAEAGGFIARGMTVAQVRDEFVRRSWRKVIDQINQGKAAA